MANLSLFEGAAGIVRILTLIFGVIVLGLTAGAFAEGGDNNGRYFCFGSNSQVRSMEEHGIFRYLLSIAIITFEFSLLWVIFFAFGIIVDSDVTKQADLWCHIIGGILLLIGGLGWLISYFIYLDNKGDEGENDFLRRLTKCNEVFALVTSGFGILDGAAFLTLAFFIWKAK